VQRWEFTAEWTKKWKMEAVLCAQREKGGGSSNPEISFWRCSITLGNGLRLLKFIGEGQGRGKFRIFLMGIYEVQVWIAIVSDIRLITDMDKLEAFTKQHPAIGLNPIRSSGARNGNYYDIIFKAPSLFDKNGWSLRLLLIGLLFLIKMAVWVCTKIMIP